MPTSDATESADQLAEFTYELEFSDLPEDVASKARLLILDSIGIQLASVRMPWVEAVAKYVMEWGSTGPATVVGQAETLSPVDASLVNGTSAHGFELDDMQPGAGVHCGCVVVPAAIAMGELLDAPFADVVLWTVVGVETMTRVGQSTSPTMLERGHHGTGAVGPIAAGALAAKALDLEQGRILNAIGIGAFQGCALLEGTIAGGTLKRLSGGVGASNGVRAALLARAGLNAPRSILDGDLGFGKAFSNEFRPEAVTSELGNEWRILDTTFKAYAQDGFIQPMTDALRIIRESHDLPVEEIDGIDIATSAFARKITDTMREPSDIASAQFSAAFSVALFLVTGKADASVYTPASLVDPVVRDLARRVRVLVDTEIDRKHMWVRAADVVVRLKDGSRLHHRVENFRILEKDDIVEKFEGLVSEHIGRSKSQDVAGLVLGGDDSWPVKTLTRSIATEGDETP